MIHFWLTLIHFVFRSISRCFLWRSNNSARRCSNFWNLSSTRRNDSPLFRFWLHFSARAYRSASTFYTRFQRTIRIFYQSYHQHSQCPQQASNSSLISLPPTQFTFGCSTTETRTSFGVRDSLQIRLVSIIFVALTFLLSRQDFETNSFPTNTTARVRALSACDLIWPKNHFRLLCFYERLRFFANFLIGSIVFILVKRLTQLVCKTTIESILKSISYRNGQQQPIRNAWILSFTFFMFRIFNFKIIFRIHFLLF